MCTAAAGFADVTAPAIAELSTTEAFAARVSCLLYRGLFSCDPTAFEHDTDAWVQRRCPAGCMLCAQLLLDSPLWWRCRWRRTLCLVTSRRRSMRKMPALLFLRQMGCKKRVRHDALSQRVPIVPICSRVQSHRAAAAPMLLPLETGAVTHNTSAAQHAKSADTSVSGADRVYEASGTLSRSLAIHHHAWL